MYDRLTVLLSAVVTGGHDFAIENQNRTNWDSTFAATFARLRDGSLHECVFGLCFPPVNGD
jgi:hypothetical protein